MIKETKIYGGQRTEFRVDKIVFTPYNRGRRWKSQIHYSLLFANCSMGEVKGKVIVDPEFIELLNRHINSEII